MNNREFLYDISFEDYHCKDGFKLPYLKFYPKFIINNIPHDTVNFVYITNSLYVTTNKTILLKATKYNYTFKKNDKVLICSNQPNINTIYIVDKFFTLPPPKNQRFNSYTKIAILKRHNFTTIKPNNIIYDTYNKTLIKYISPSKGWIHI